MARRWDDAVGDYERIGSEIGRQGVETPRMDDNVLVNLLAASTPGSPVAVTLRVEAHRTRTKDALSCRWFSELGTPEDMPVASLVMLPHLLPQAEKEGRLTRRRPWRGCIGGIIVGGLFGGLVEQAGTPYYGASHSFETAFLLVQTSIAFVVAVWWYRGGFAEVLHRARGVWRWIARRIAGFRGQ